MHLQRLFLVSRDQWQLNLLFLDYPSWEVTLCPLLHTVNLQESLQYFIFWIGFIPFRSSETHSLRSSRGSHVCFPPWVFLQAARWSGSVEFVLWRGVCPCAELQSRLQWGSLPSGRKMAKEATALECTNSLRNEKRIHLVPSLVDCRCPPPPAVLSWAGAMWAGTAQGWQAKTRRLWSALLKENNCSPAGCMGVNHFPGAFEARASTVVCWVVCGGFFLVALGNKQDSC